MSKRSRKIISIIDRIIFHIIIFCITNIIVCIGYYYLSGYGYLGRTGYILRDNLVIWYQTLRALLRVWEYSPITMMQRWRGFDRILDDFITNWTRYYRYGSYEYLRIFIFSFIELIVAPSIVILVNVIPIYWIFRFILLITDFINSLFEEDEDR